MLLFTFNLGAYSAKPNGNARPMVRQNGKVELRYGYAAMIMTTPGIDYQVWAAYMTITCQ